MPQFLHDKHVFPDRQRLHPPSGTFAPTSCITPAISASASPRAPCGPVAMRSDPSGGPAERFGVLHDVTGYARAPRSTTSSGWCSASSPPSSGLAKSACASRSGRWPATSCAVCGRTQAPQHRAGLRWAALPTGPCRLQADDLFGCDAPAPLVLRRAMAARVAARAGAGLLPALRAARVNAVDPHRSR